ncbi:MAG: single-stranded DNA-binding protein [Longimicrobiaceae bacterium]
MSRSLNKALIIGNLGADPEIRTTGSGTRVAQLSIATSRSWSNKEGDEQEKTEWHRVVAWAKLAEVVERYLKKGDRVYIEGEIQYRSYEDKDGVTKYSTEINAREMIMLGGKDGGAPQGGQSSGSGYEDYEAPSMKEDDDLPF